MGRGLGTRLLCDCVRVLAGPMSARQYVGNVISPEMTSARRENACRGFTGHRPWSTLRVRS